VEITFHAHNAPIAAATRLRAERIVGKLALRVRRPVDAVVRIDPDGPLRRVEIVLRAPRHNPIVGRGTGRSVGPALAEAAANISVQLAKLKPHRRAANGRAR
jgi:ribosome-associated translation inhibitor RaiA